MSPDSIQLSEQEDAVRRASIDRSLRHPVMFFFTSGAAWLAVSILFGVIASVKLHHPDFLASCGFLTYGRVFPAHMSTLIYGWGMQAAFASLIWLMARLSRKECQSSGTILAAGHVWNFSVLLGTIGILSGHGSGMQWMEFPSFVWPVFLVTYFVIAVWSFIYFRVRPEGHVYVSQWYLIAAMVWFPWMYLTANTLLHCMPGNPVMGAAINAWFKSGMMFLFFVPIGLGVAYYLAPKVTGRPVFSYQLAKVGFWTLAVVAPWAGMQKLMGAPVPYFLPYLGAAATAVLFIPCVSAAANCIRTMTANLENTSASPSLRFTFAGLVALIIYALAGVLLNLPGSTLRTTQFSFSGYGYDILGLYGFFTFIMFAATYFIVPRITRREWISSRLIRTHYIFSCYGTVFVALVAIFGGMMQGSAQEEWNQPWAEIADTAYPYAMAISIAWALILFSNVFFFIHLAFMWIGLGRRSSHPTLIKRAHHGSPHGPEGDIDNAGPGHASAH